MFVFTVHKKVDSKKLNVQNTNIYEYESSPQLSKKTNKSTEACDIHIDIRPGFHMSTYRRLIRTRLKHKHKHKTTSISYSRTKANSKENFFCFVIVYLRVKFTLVILLMVMLLVRTRLRRARRILRSLKKRPWERGWRKVGDRFFL